ncbi:MAG: hypothetical protein J6334_14015 [Kiritimatiellae bacterium]|nr:hypothetical protein [Kiritimatiellia bacterium]
MRPFTLIAALAIPAGVLAETATFEIGVYCLAPYARTEQHIKDIRDCHVDFVCGVDYNDRKTLDLFAKYGLKAIVHGAFPNWWGGNKGSNGKMAEVISPQVVTNGVAAMKATGADLHPAVSMVSIGDEPSALDFPYYHDLAVQLGKLLPRQVPHVNLHPCYPPVEADFGYVGATNYYAYIDAYMENVPLDYLSYDHYLYTTLPRPVSMGPFLRNFKIVADACRRTGRRFWFVPQVNSRDPEVIITEQKLRYQANMAMAFGAETLVWACWTAGWWQMNVLDTNGVKTVQYDRLKGVNAEIRCLAPRFMEFRNVDTRLVGFGKHPDWINGSDSTFVAALDGGFFRRLKAEDDDALVVGIMTDRRDASSRKALFVVAAEDPWDEAPKTRTVSFEGVGNISAFAASGPVPLHRAADGDRYTFDLKSNGAVLVIFEK